METPTTFVIGNWKMHGTRARAVQLTAEVGRGVAQLAKRIRIGICPPAVHIDAVRQATAGHAIEIGGQDVAPADSGAFTGDISAPMLRDLGCTFCIVGHSERRAGHAESSDLVAEKFVAAGRCGLRPVLCIGESREQREAGDTGAVVRSQLVAVLERAGVEAFHDAIVAYEPVWAIGTGLTASPEQAQEVHAMIRAIVAERDEAIGHRLPLLYGGSVKPDNAAALFAMADVNGGLIGGASLESDAFLAICEAAAQSAGAHNEV